jgi:hypothetical protein
VTFVNSNIMLTIIIQLVVSNLGIKPVNKTQPRTWNGNLIEMKSFPQNKAELWCLWLCRTDHNYRTHQNTLAM